MTTDASPDDDDPIITGRLAALFGVEHDGDAIARELKYLIQGLKPARCGAHLVTCSDELEGEADAGFRQWFAQDMLPALRIADRSPFRTACLGGRYEWGGARIAEANFSSGFKEEAEAGGAKVLLIKIHSHVAMDATGAAPAFGMYPRYGGSSNCCGALRGLLAGASGAPVFDELREVFHAEDLDRLAMLRDPAITPPEMQMLSAAVVQARVQARQAMLDIQDHHPVTPTLYLIAPSISLNRPGRDGEILAGLYIADHRTADRTERYMGLGDDPARYVFETSRQPIRIADPGLEASRPARDHRALVLETWRDARKTSDADPQPLPGAPDVAAALEDGAAQAKNRPEYARVALKAALPLLIEFAPVPAAVLCFAGGAFGMHQALRMHRIARSVEADAEARAVLAQLEHSLDDMPPERARCIVELLGAHFKG